MSDQAPQVKETVILPLSITETQQLPLITDTQYLEIASSISLNRKFFGIARAGIYRGFACVPDQGLNVKIKSTQSQNGKAVDFGVALIEREDFLLHVRQQHDITLPVPAGATSYVVLEAFYKYGVKTKQVSKDATVDAASVQVLPERAVKPHHLILAKVVVPNNVRSLKASYFHYEDRKAGGYDLDSHKSELDPHDQYLQKAHAAVETEIDSKASSRLKYINLSMLWRALAKNLSVAKEYTLAKYHHGKGYTDTKHGEALAEVNEAKEAGLAYTRSKVSQAKAEAKSYTDTKYGDAIHHTNTEKGKTIRTLKAWAENLFFKKSGGELTGSIHIKKGSNESGELIISEAGAKYGGGMQYEGIENFFQFFTWSNGARQWFMRVARGSKDIKFAGDLYAKVTKRVYHDSYHPRADVASNAEKLNGKDYTQIIGEAKNFTTEQHDEQKVYFEDKHSDAITYTDNKLVEAKQYADRKHNTQQSYINDEVGKAKQFAQGLHNTQQEYVNQQIAAVIGANVPSDLNSIKELIEEIQSNETAINVMRNIQANKLDKNATAVNSTKFAGKTYEQARSDFRSGLITSQRAVSNSVTSSSSIVAASSKAAKTAMDKAKSAYALAAQKITKAQGDGWWLGKNSKAVSAATADKLEGKSKDQVVEEARAGKSADADKLDGVSSSGFARSYPIKIGSSGGKRRYVRLVSLQKTDDNCSFLLHGLGDFAQQSKTMLQVQVGTRNNNIVVDAYSLNQESTSEAPQLFTKLNGSRFELWLLTADYNLDTHNLILTNKAKATVHVDSITVTTPLNLSPVTIKSIYNSGYKPTSSDVGAYSTSETYSKSEIEAVANEKIDSLSGAFVTKHRYQNDHFCKVLLLLCPVSTAKDGVEAGRFLVNGRLLGFRGGARSTLSVTDVDMTIGSAYQTSKVQLSTNANTRNGSLVTCTYNQRKYFAWDITSNSNAQNNQWYFSGYLHGTDSNFLKAVRYKGDGTSGNVNVIANSEVHDSIESVEKGTRAVFHYGISSLGEIRENNQLLAERYLGITDKSESSKIADALESSARSAIIDQSRQGLISEAEAEQRYFKKGGDILQIGEGLEFCADNNYFGENLDARIIRLRDRNNVNGNVDGGLIIQSWSNDEETQELIRIRNGEFKWKGHDIYHRGFKPTATDVNAIPVSDRSNIVKEAKDYTNSKFNQLLGSGADALTDTIGELAQLFKSNKSILTTLQQAIGEKFSKKGGIINNGKNTAVHIRSNDDGRSELNLTGDVQGTGRVFVGQEASLKHGGGIEYNGDSNPATTGAGSDFITLFRRKAGVDHWTAKNHVGNNDWEFRAAAKAVKFVEDGESLSDKYLPIIAPSLRGDIDFNDYVKTGNYNVYSTSTMKNRPPQGCEFGTLQVIGSNSSSRLFVTQTFIDRSSGKMAIRGRTDGSAGWSAWRMIYNEAYKPTAEDVGALSKNAKAVDSDKFDGLNSSQFLRSDVDNNILGSLLWSGDQDWDGLYWGGRYKDGNAHSSAWGYIRQGQQQGQLEIGSDDKINIYETDTRNLAISISTNNKTLDAIGGLLENGVKLADKYLGKTAKAADSLKLDGKDSKKFVQFNNITMSPSTNMEQFITELRSHGALKGAACSFKCSWSYSGNSDLVTGDSDIGTIELAGCVIETWGIGESPTKGTYHIRITRPTTGAGGDATMLVYNCQGENYRPSWTEIYTNKNKPTAADVGAPTITELEVAVENAIPAGIPLPWGSDIPPDGYAVMKGQAIDPKYTKLKAIYGSKLPDMRGQAVVGKMSNEEVLSKVLNGIKSHNHTGAINNYDHGQIQTSSNGNHNHTADVKVTNLGSKASSSSGSHGHGASLTKTNIRATTQNAGAHSHHYSRISAIGSVAGPNHYGWGDTAVPQSGWSASRQVSGHSGAAVGFRLHATPQPTQHLGNHRHSVDAGSHDHRVTISASGSHVHTVDLGSHSHDVEVSYGGAHTHTVDIGSHTHSMTINPTGNAKNTIDAYLFNWIVRLA